MKTKIQTTQKVLWALHDGTPITDTDLCVAIDWLRMIYETLDIQINSMPEYSVCAKALNRDLDTLLSYRHARETSKARKTRIK